MSERTEKRTKIVATMGPATRSERTIAEMIEAGMNVARLNFSHGGREQHSEITGWVRKAAIARGVPVAVLADIPGQAVRTGALSEASVRLEDGATIRLTEEEVDGDASEVSVDYKDYSRHIDAGMQLLLGDGDMRLRVTDVGRGYIDCRVLSGGTLRERQRVTAPEANIPLSRFDPRFIDFAKELGADYIGASFVKRAADVEEVRQHLGSDDVGLIAKIETREAVADIDDIIVAADGVMIARGDLGMRVAIEDVPLVQKDITSRVNSAGKPVIVATQMLKSMVDQRRPTRAEASDVANAILDGADAVMLSEETAIGRHPVEAIKVMGRIARRVERSEGAYGLVRGEEKSMTEAVGESACRIAARIGAAAIVVATTSGFSARLVAKFRPAIPIVAVTPSASVRNRLALVWGVRAVEARDPADDGGSFAGSIAAARRIVDIPDGSAVVITGGAPSGVAGTTNLIKIERV